MCYEYDYVSVAGLSCPTSSLCIVDIAWAGHSTHCHTDNDKR